jgi:hypothetical protein
MKSKKKTQVQPNQNNGLKISDLTIDEMKKIIHLACYGVQTCHDCGVKEGQLHHRGCDMERCPVCHEQLITCECPFKHFGIDVSPDIWVYYRIGLTKDQLRKWESILKKKGRIPYIQEGVFCYLCGSEANSMWMVPNKEWQKYVPPNLQKQVLCENCYNKCKRLMPNGWRKAKEPPERIKNG